ncbi:hypothetical protein FN846DRAFT_477800 [Sphaerosporella brunnea]|uniref:Uncharacterized protein n=1 Tax=Sphaerosporella brunnea TaxID=1250544 RepID=A0A5J5FB71_9PEZI|nr:hypothetical protein FN846DRAFT_477800 [Sphaerosporella brunnea]
MTKRKKSKQQQQQQQQQQQNKRARFDDDGGGPKFDASRGYLDPATGQRGAFPGLERDQEEFFGPPMDGLDYLRMVRSEAKGVPDLLLSSKAPPPPKARRPPPPPPADDVVLDYDEPSREPTEEAKEEDEEEKDYIFSESTYISLHRSAPSAPIPPYHAPILARFRQLHKKLHSTPPKKSPHNPHPRWSDLKQWRKFVGTTMPRPQWVWGMQQWEVMRLLKQFRGWMEWRAKVRNAAGRGVPKAWPVWIWALLVRCECVMGAEEVAVVRELGKAALMLLAGMGSGELEDTAETDELGETEAGIKADAEHGEEDGEVPEKDHQEKEEEEEGEVPDPNNNKNTTPKPAAEEEGDFRSVEETLADTYRYVLRCIPTGMYLYHAILFTEVIGSQ